MPDLKVVFEDDFLIVFNKPAGMVVDKSETQVTDTLEDILRNHYRIGLERGGIVHRLDKDTSGLIVVAKTSQVLENLQSQFKSREVKKRYLALVHGFLKEKRIVKGNIGRNPGNREKFIVMNDEDRGKDAVTDFNPIEFRELEEKVVDELFADFNKIQRRKLMSMNYTQFTLVECIPQTGRTHQIRVHLKHIGFPIVGDDKYGGRKVVRLDHRFCQRQFLHAARLSFKHPVSGEIMEFECPLADDLKNSWNLLTPYLFN